MNETSVSNNTLYERGLRYAGLVEKRTAAGERPAAALRRVAADAGRDVEEVRRAVHFREAVDVIAENVGPAAKKLILVGQRVLAPERVMQLSRTHPDRQRYEMAQIEQGRALFAKPLPGVVPPYDTLGMYEILSRLARSSGLINVTVGAITATSRNGGLTPEKSAKIAANAADLKSACATMRAELASAAVLPDAPDATTARRRTGGPGRPPIEPGRAPGFVASALGLVGKCARDLPRLLRESPPGGADVADALAGLGRVEAAASRLEEAVREYAPPAPAERTPGRRGAVAGKDDVPANTGGAPIVEALSGPAASGGTYLVIFRLDADATVAVGALGTYDFPAGFYAYIGSAFGTGGVRARTDRHLRPEIARKKWNIDHLKPPLLAVEVWWTHDPVKRECTWAAVMASSPGFGCPSPGFGSHDCRVNRAAGVGSPGGRLCKAHLVHSLDRPDVHEFAARLGRLVPGHDAVYRQRLDRAEQGGVAPDRPGANPPSSSQSRRPATTGRPGNPTEVPTPSTGADVHPPPATRPKAGRTRP